ncbi:MAG: GNAT family N-acetyltransferase [Phycisphaerales bacterium]|jgi:hypothetical protein|nr:GNAT family N-acetyltransferase [Phycisphaerales bacterium]
MSIEIPGPRELAEHCDRAARITNRVRPETVADVPRGWARVRAGGESDEFASTGFNRVHWFTLESAITDEELRETVGVLRSRGVRRAFFWMNAAGCEGSGLSALERIDAVLVPHVRYVVLARRGGTCVPTRASTLVVRGMSARELPSVLGAMGERFSPESARAACKLVESGIAEAFAAFDGDVPAAFAALIPDRAGDGFGHLGWAGTVSGSRGRGGQSALIAARVSRAAELGLRWCVSETNTVIPTSLNNLIRLGFVAALEWKVFRWDDRAGA